MSYSTIFSRPCFAWLNFEFAFIRRVGTLLIQKRRKPREEVRTRISGEQGDRKTRNQCFILTIGVRLAYTLNVHERRLFRPQGGTKSISKEHKTIGEQNMRLVNCHGAAGGSVMGFMQALKRKGEPMEAAYKRERIEVAIHAVAYKIRGTLFVSVADIIKTLMLTVALLTGSNAIAQDKIDPAILKAVFGISIDDKIIRAITYVNEQCGILFANEELHPIQHKVPTWPGIKITPVMFSNGDYVTETEKPLVLSWLKKLKQCYEIGSALRTVMPSQSIPAYENFRRFDDFFISQLLIGRITYGELTNYRVVMTEDLKLSINASFVWPEHAESIINEVILGWQGLAKYYEASGFKK